MTASSSPSHRSGGQRASLRELDHGPGQAGAATVVSDPPGLDVVAGGEGELHQPHTDRVAGYVQRVAEALPVGTPVQGTGQVDPLGLVEVDA